jgi:hypothetical protein
MMVGSAERSLRVIGPQLAVWAALSVAAGAALIVMGTPLWRAFGVQAVAWGAIDGAIAWFGMRDHRRKRRTLGARNAEWHAEVVKVRRILLLNVWLDVGYVTVGLLIASFGAEGVRLGHGLGVIVQGAFLLAFDAFHYGRLRDWVTPRRRDASASEDA